MVQEAYFCTSSLTSCLTRLPPSLLPLPPSFFSLSWCVCPSVCHPSASMTADMWQYSCVDDKRRANYLAACFRASQTLTSCERVWAHVRAPRHEGTSARVNFNDMKSRRGCSVEITSPLNSRPFKRSPITGRRILGVSANFPPASKLFPTSPSRSHLLSICAEKLFCSIFNYLLI